MKAWQVLTLGAAGVTALGVGRLWRQRPAPSPAPGMLTMVDGELMHYVDTGQGEPVVFIHGFGGSVFSWRHAFDEFGKGRRIIAVDLAGFGHSTRDASRPMGHDAQAARVHRLLEQLSVRKATVVGHSMGGAIAQRLAVRHPGDVGRLVLVASMPATAQERWRRASGRLRGVSLAGPLLQRSDMLMRWLFARGLKEMVFDASIVDDAMVEGYLAPLRAPGTSDCLARLARDAKEEDGIELGRITCPTLVVTGAHDSVIAAEVGAALRAGITGARHIVMEQSGHLPAEEEPERFYSELESFIAATEASRA